MSSKIAVDPGWSLTGRLTAIFAATTSALIALYALWSAHFVYSSKLDAIHAFLEHETQELGMLIARTSGTPAEIVLATDSIAAVSEEPPCAFRVRDRSGLVIAESGVAQLLARPVVEMSWREALFGQPASSLVSAEPVHALTVEVVTDVSEYIDDIQAYLMSSVVAFLVAVVLASLAGWFTADRGLRGLHEVVQRAGHVDFPSRGVTLNLAGAPREVRDVGVALEDMIRRIDDGLARMRTFTAGLAHELRSPLQSLIGRTEVALLRVRSPSEYEQALHGNLDDLHELSDAVDNMVALCRTATPDRHTQPTQEFDLAEESRLRLEREQRSAERAGVSVEIVARGDTRLVADREACLRVVRNLVSNAIVWSPEGGRVRMEIADQGAEVGLIVDDQGPGIPADLADKVFEPFVSGRARSGRRGSYGLGLAICKSVVGEHGGSIRFEPRPEGGTRFLVRIPRQPAVAVATLQEGTSSAALGKAPALATLRSLLVWLPCLLASGCASPPPEVREAAPLAAIPQVEAGYSVPDVQLTDQHGRTLPLADWLPLDRDVALNFVFTTCTTICPVMSATFTQVQAELAELEPAPLFVSISLDPEYDTPPVLQQYAGRFGADTRWTLLTGRAPDVLSVLESFDVLSGSKLNHKPYTYLRAAGSRTWVRLEGLLPSSALATEIARMAAKREG